MADDNKRGKFVPHIPFDLIFEILTWVSIEHLLRFQCVCKDWYALIRNPKFIERQFERASSFQKISDLVKEEIDGILQPINVNQKYKKFVSCFGLFLEMSLTDSRSCRIRNPVTRQVVYLPLAHKGANQYDFALNKVTGECKVVCYYHNGNCEAGFQVITVGDEQWRPMRHPNQELLEQGILFADHGAYIGANNGIGHFADLIEDGEGYRLEVHTLEKWKECIISTCRVPQEAFEDLSEVLFCQWDGRVAVAKIGDEDISVLRLEDYMENRWTERKIVVQLEILKDEPDLDEEIIKLRACSNELTIDAAGSRIYYDMTRQVVLAEYDMESTNEDEAFTWLRPSLMALKGMKREE
ncbi:F-box/kelch-repeat protein At4g19930-like [Rosa chinensis]|uniref:F-box/kelch-repeat protein At4g19930-like n=1 Tax=Rosa chinensis TaxID=74649 RepID=UPI000D093011|nr:F-box/kelch-repeat protein At4g19930-like [Rosa chinensis]